ncbi:MAG TPA: PHB depolymerase family esterase [Acidimicrobiales bacterium]|nr:PHB depolymerase family esterase [Acidimicrobiales bacterium]
MRHDRDGTGPGPLDVRMPRRRLLGAAAWGLAAIWSACQRDVIRDVARGVGDGGRGPARLKARPHPPSQPSPGPGVHPLGLEPVRDGLVFVPAGLPPDRPAPLLVMLHGAGGDARGGLGVLGRLAEERGVVVVAPDSRGRTWDVILGAYGPDVAFVDRALAQAFDRHAVDPARVAIGGFSDGASYALSLGLANGDLFHHVLAFSPGFSASRDGPGRPRFFVSHGTDDGVLPIASTSRRIVPDLEREGYAVRYREFAGGHAVPPEVVEEAVAWFLMGG